MKRIFSALLFLGLALTAGESPGKALALADNDRLLFITYADCENLEADEGSVRAYASLRLDPETLETFPALESLEGRTTVSRLSGLPAIVITPGMAGRSCWWIHDSSNRCRGTTGAPWCAPVPPGWTPRLPYTWERSPTAPRPSRPR